jgi:phage gp37-like protein
MTDLLIDQSIAQVEQALLDVLTLGLKLRLPPVADVATLRATPTVGASGGTSRSDGDLVYVASQQNVYRWTQAASAADDGDAVVQPADVTRTGRWLKASSAVLFAGVNVATIPTGYLKDVILHNGDFNEDVIKSRIYGQAPCVAIHFAGEDHTPLSQIPGALYGYTCRFEIWSVSRNYRAGPEAAIGSPIPAEAASDPSVMRIHGAVKKLLAGQDLGQPSIKYIELGAGHIEEADEAERVFVMSLAIEVRASIHNADAPAELFTPSGVDVQKSFAALGDQPRFDASNYVASGLDVPAGGGFTKTIGAGTAYLAGALVNVPASVQTFAPESDAYRDLGADGTWTLTSVAAGSAAPLAQSNALRVGVTTMDAFGVVADRFIAAVNTPYSAPDQIAL